MKMYNFGWGGLQYKYIIMVFMNVMIVFFFFTKNISWLITQNSLLIELIDCIAFQQIATVEISIFNH